MNISVSEVARSLELYELQRTLHSKARNKVIALEFTKRPLLQKIEDIKKVVVAFGSYDPFSVAHENLFHTGVQAVEELSGNKEDLELIIVTSTNHFEKKIDLTKNSTVYDRIHAQEGFASCYDNVSLAFFNDPFFFNLKDTLEGKYRKDVELYFLVGADVMEKIAERKGYEKYGFDMDKVLGELFKHHFIVNKRNVTYKDGREPRILTKDILVDEIKELEQYKDRIIGTQIDSELKALQIPIEDVSSSIIRERRKKKLSIQELTAVGISEFVDKHSMYLEDPTHYEALVCVRQMYADHHRAQGTPRGKYIHSLLDHIEIMQGDLELRKETIKAYGDGVFLQL